MHNRHLDMWHYPLIKRSLVVLVICLILFYGVIPQLKQFGIDFRFSTPRDWTDIGIAFLWLALSFIVAGINFWLLSLRKLKLAGLVLVQMASIIPSKLLPSGFGNMGTNYLYFRSHGFSSGASGLASSMNNMIGAVVNLTLLGVLLVISGSKLSLGTVYKFNWYSATLALLVVFVVLLVGVIASGHIRRLRRLHDQIVKALRHYRKHPLQLMLVAVSAACLALVNVLIFWFCLRAYSVHLSLVASYLIFSLSIAIGTAIPTPGGLGGVEAGMSAGLIALHVPSITAISSVLAFRLVSFWLPILPGMVALLFVERRHMISWPEAAAFLRK